MHYSLRLCCIELAAPLRSKQSSRLFMFPLGFLLKIPTNTTPLTFVFQLLLFPIIYLHYLFTYFQFNNLKLQTSNLANHHLDVIKQLKELQFRILDQELNRWKRDQQLSGNGAPFTNNLDTIQKWCEDLAEVIWINMQQIRQLEMIQEQLNIPSQELTVNILPELSDGLTMLLDSLVKSSFVIGEYFLGSNIFITLPV